MQEILPFWDEKEMKLKGSQIYKARKFVKDGLVLELGVRQWRVKPIKGYNKTTYTVYGCLDGSYTCNCQFHCQTGKDCSHIIAVMLHEANILQ